MAEHQDPGFVWRGSTLDGNLRRLQRQLWVEDPFLAVPPDGNKSGSVSFLRETTAGGVGNMGNAAGAPGSSGVAAFSLPARAAPVAPDGAGFRFSSSGTVIIDADDLVGEACLVWRVRNSNPPQAGSDYIVYAGVVDSEVNQAEPSDGFYIFGSVASPNWFLRHRRAGVLVEVDSGMAMATDAWQTFAAIANVDDNLVRILGANDGDPMQRLADVTPVNIQPAVALTAMGAMHNPGNITLAAQILVDYVAFGIDYGVWR